jgi:hypothetical protein
MNDTSVVGADEQPSGDGGEGGPVAGVYAKPTLTHLGLLRTLTQTYF